MQGGIIVDTLGISQLAIELTAEVNKLDQLEEYWDVILFYHTYDLVIKTPKFAMLQELELWGFQAPVLATDLSTAHRLLQCPGPTKKLFYVWEMEWMFGSYDEQVHAPIYMNKDLELIARNDEQAKIISNCWREPAGILDGFNHEQLTKLFAQKS